MGKRAKESGKRIQLILSAVKVRPRVRRHACNFKGNARQFAFNLTEHHKIRCREIFCDRAEHSLSIKVLYSGRHLTQGRVPQYDACHSAVVEVYSAE